MKNCVSQLKGALQPSTDSQLANRSGGPRHRQWEARNEAIVNELVFREKEGSMRDTCIDTIEGARAQVSDGARAQVPDGARANGGSNNSSGVLRFPVQYAVDCERIETRMIAEEMGLKPLTVKDKIKARLVHAQERGNLEEARKFQDQLDGMNERESVKRRAKKLRKRNIAICRREMNNRDPNSGDEGDGAAQA